MASVTHIPQVVLGHDAYGFTLEGRADALRALAAAVVSTGRIELSAEGDASGASVTVKCAEGPLVMTHDGAHAALRGSQASLEDFAATVRNLAKGRARPNQVKFHVHVEYFPGHTWIAESSDSVIAYLVE
jgi:hypothetical protein